MAFFFLIFLLYFFIEDRSPTNFCFARTGNSGCVTEHSVAIRLRSAREYPECLRRATQDTNGRLDNLPASTVRARFAVAWESKMGSA